MISQYGSAWKRENRIGRKNRGHLVRWAAAFFLFFAAAAAVAPHLLARRLPAPPPQGVDALFVLAGGENRIAAAFRAWKKRVGKELYVLGAGKEATVKGILPPGEEPSVAGLSKIHVEGWSENTLENAFSARSVAIARGFRSVVLVTSDYHLPRAYLALKKFMPRDTAIFVAPVASDFSGLRPALRSLRRFALEGWKYWVFCILLAWE